MKSEEEGMRSEEEWREILDEDSYRVLREAATERPCTGALLNENRRGEYFCKGCGNKLFGSEAKFDSGCGWPSFFEAIPGSVEFLRDNSLGVERIEVRCAKCGGHLGHVFADAPQTPTGQRYCMNSVALTFRPAGGGPEKLG